MEGSGGVGVGVVTGEAGGFSGQDMEGGVCRKRQSNRVDSRVPLAHRARGLGSPGREHFLAREEALRGTEQATLPRAMFSATWTLCPLRALA